MHEDEPDSLAFPTFKPVKMEMTFTDVDPDVLGLLTGGVLGTPHKPDFTIEVTSFVPVRRRAWRVVWEWLRRTPRKHTEHHYFIPHATLVSGNEEGA